VSLSASSHDPRWRLLNWPLLALVLALHGAVLFMLSRHDGINERAPEPAEAPQFQVSLLATAPHSPQDAVAAGDAPDKRQRMVHPEPPSPSAQAAAAPARAAEQAAAPDTAASTRAAAPDTAASIRAPAPDAAAPARTPAPAAAASKPAPVKTHDQGPGQNPKPTVDQFAVRTSPQVSGPFGGSSRATSEPDGGSDGVASGPKSNTDRSPDSNPNRSPDSSPEPGQKTRQNLTGHGQTGVDAQASFDAPSRAAPVTRTQPRVDASWTGNIPPPYPALARRLKLEGEVWLSVHVAADGRVLQAGIARSSGHDMLDATAVESVKKWRFEPATLDGKPVADWYHDWRWYFRIHD
jgi:TonB family protein